MSGLLVAGLLVASSIVQSVVGLPPPRIRRRCGSTPAFTTRMRSVSVVQRSSSMSVMPWLLFSPFARPSAGKSVYLNQWTPSRYGRASARRT